MANTERFKVLKLVRKAKSAARDAISAPHLKPAQSSIMGKLIISLDKLEDDLILSEIDERIDDIKSSSKHLGRVASTIRKDIKKLKKVADLVDKAAKALKTLADIAVKAASLGTV